MMFDFTSEKQVGEELLKIAKTLDTAAKVVIASRAVKERSFVLNTRFLIMASPNNMELVISLLTASKSTNGALVFDGSELVVQGGSLEIDYLYMMAKITPKIS